MPAVWPGGAFNSPRPCQKLDEPLLRMLKRLQIGSVSCRCAGRADKQKFAHRILTSCAPSVFPTWAQALLRSNLVKIPERLNKAETDDVAANSPISAAEAIEWGQEAFSKGASRIPQHLLAVACLKPVQVLTPDGVMQGDYQRALDLFREVFTLPGSGSMRYSGTVKEISCASAGEENAAVQPQPSLHPLCAPSRNTLSSSNLASPLPAFIHRVTQKDMTTTP
eukprot:1179695-Prorocentrum_minimum.AAC.1